jgi:glycosyltransferase involved in cell wall biosynthesis
MKSVHISNIANMAYGYAKMLNARDFDTRVVCHDIKHLMSQPEWDDIELDPADFPNEADFFENKANFGAYTRPTWFKQDHISFKDFIASVRESVIKEPNTKLHLSVWLLQTAVDLGKLFPFGIRQWGKRIILGWIGRHELIATGKSQAEWSDTEKLIQSNLNRVQKLPSYYGLDWGLALNEVLAYAPQARWLNHHLDDAEIVFAYAAAPIYPMILRSIPYVAVEIGTIRELPFEATTWGRMIGLGYREADHVLITNPDNYVAAKRLGLKSFSFCPHPVDEKIFTPCALDNPTRAELLSKYQTDFLFIAPARQNWALKGNDLMLRAFSIALQSGLNAQLIIPTWGQDIEQSQRLAEDLKITTKVDWIKPMTERGLIKYYQAVDAVLDQFVLGVFGLTTPKAMSCGIPVLCAYDEEPNSWCFKEHPPILRCSSTQEIAAKLLLFKTTPAEMKQAGKDARQWILRNHSSETVVAVLRQAAITAAQRFNNRVI